MPIPAVTLALAPGASMRTVPVPGTAEVGALCLDLARDATAAEALNAYFDVFTDHYLKAKQQLPVDAGDERHARLADLALAVRG